MSFGTVPSLRGSSVSSNRASMMSIDDEYSSNILGNTPGSHWSGVVQPQHMIPDGALQSDNMSLVLGSQDESLFSSPQETTPTHDVVKGTPQQTEPPKFHCTYCTGSNRPAFRRSSDWKDHETNYHQPGRKFLCPHSRDTSFPCRADFLSNRGVQKHHQDVHRHNGCKKDCEGLREVRPTVFACGFVGCTRLFTDMPDLNRDAWWDRCKHVAGHFESGRRINEWNYSHMILNLLHQPGLLGLWDELAIGRAVEQGLDQSPSYLWTESPNDSMRHKLETHYCRAVEPNISAHIKVFLQEVYAKATLHFPGLRAIRNIGLSSSITVNDHHGGNDAGQMTVSQQQTLDPAAHLTSAAPVANEQILRSNYTSEPEDYTMDEGTLRPRGRQQPRSGSTSPSGSSTTRNRSRSIKGVASRERLALSGYSTPIDDSTTYIPPVPPVPTHLTQSMVQQNHTIREMDMQNTQMHSEYMPNEWFAEQRFYPMPEFNQTQALLQGHGDQQFFY